MDYTSFLQSKRMAAQAAGFQVSDISARLFPFQADIVQWALRRGRSALFEDCGLGKTPQQLEWAKHVSAHTKRPVLVLAPLAVSGQTAREGQKFGIDVHVVSSEQEVRDGINVTNYEKLHHFSRADRFGGIVLDESSILKGFDGKTRRRVTDFGRAVNFRLACTATPAPNDHMELGNHAEFLGVMNVNEMLASFFIHDGGDTSKWRLKGHASSVFWKWMASWSVCIRKPSDLGYDDGDFMLPPMHLHQHSVSSRILDGFLFSVEAQTLTERHQARRDSINERVEEAASLVNNSADPWVVWCNLNDESAALTKAIPDAVEVRGSDSPEHKESAMLGFAAGQIRVLVTKPSIAGFGLNWQHCAHMAFVGLSDSYEELYQATRRCWRFGQKRDVHCHIITAEAEGAVVRNIERKEKQAMEMVNEMVQHMKDLSSRDVRGAERERDPYDADKRITLPAWIGGAK